MELNFTKTKTNLMPVNFIYRKILKIYSFLTLKERNIFIKKSEKMINKFKKGKLIGEETIKRILSFVDGSGHADIREYQKPDRDFMRRVKPQRVPSFKIKNRILTIKISSWLVWLGRIDKTLNSFCRKNVKKYDAIIIDVRENNGGSSNLAYSFASIFLKSQLFLVRPLEVGKTKNLKLV